MTHGRQQMAAGPRTQITKQGRQYRMYLSTITATESWQEDVRERVSGGVVTGYIVEVKISLSTAGKEVEQCLKNSRGRSPNSRN